MRRPLRPALLLTLLLVAACTPKPEPIFGSGPDGARTITIRVANRNFDDATVYAYRYNERRRAGIVGPKSTEDLTVRWSTPASLRVEIRMLAGQQCTTREMQARPGDVIRVEIPIDFRTGVCQTE